MDSEKKAVFCFERGTTTICNNEIRVKVGVRVRVRAGVRVMVRLAIWAEVRVGVKDGVGLG